METAESFGDLEDVDVSSLSYKEWLKFFFDRPGEEELNRLTSRTLIGDESRLLEYLHRCNTDIVSIRKRFSESQIDRAFWALYAGNLWAGELLISEGIDLDTRFAVIDSLGFLYSQHVTQLQSDIKGTVYWMLWDLIVPHANDRWRHFNGHLADSILLLAKFGDVLGKILHVENYGCQVSALHGLGHLATPAAKAHIAAYLDSHPGLTPTERAYAADCYSGKIL